MRGWRAILILAPVLAALGAAGGWALERSHGEALRELQDQARAAEREPAVRLEAEPRAALERIVTALGPGPWPQGGEWADACLRFSDEEDLARAVFIIDVQGVLIFPGGLPWGEPPPRPASVPGASRGDGPEALLQRARAAEPLEARRLLDEMAARYGARPVVEPWTWRWLAVEEHIHLDAILGRSAALAARATDQAREAERSGGAAGAAAYLRRVLETQGSGLDAGQRAGLAARLQRLERRCAQERELADVLTAWRAGHPDVPGQGGWVQLSGQRLLFAPRGPQGSVGLLLDHDALENRVAALEAERMQAALQIERRRAELGARRVLLLGLLGAGLLSLALAGLSLLRALAERERLARLRADFVAAVSHDLRTPLTSIRALGETLAAGRRPDRAELYGQTIVDDAARMERMIQRILGYTRRERGLEALSLEALDLAELARRAVDQYRGAPAGALRLRTDGAAAICRVDERALTEALWNLIENALRYGPADGPVDIEVGVAAGQGFLRVRDHGVGIPAAERALIFQPFFRGAHPQVVAAGGTGLGLAQVDAALRAHGGRVEVEAAEDGGTCFTLWLPR